MRGVEVVQLLECEPRLGEGLSEAQRAAAIVALPAETVTLTEGPWLPNVEPPGTGWIGYFLVEGLIVRRVQVGPGTSVELLGQGDLLRPWLEDASSFCTPSWEVLEQATLALLGPDLTIELGRWPTIAANVAGRGMERSRAFAADSAIASIVGLGERLIILLWHIAERWGEARTDGVHITIRLPHRLLAELVGARRPSVTSALGELQGAGRLDSTAGGCWILLGDPPC